jgi:ElaB/YqjD/DUF883 family membrane-anchored ribosome-binding protein
MSDEQEMIRRRMSETCSSLAEKIETLEQTVTQTVTGTTAAVTDTVASVKEAVQETVDTVKGTVQQGVNSVKNAMDLSLQVQRHPWMFVAGSVAVGYFGGLLLREQDCDRGRYGGASRAYPSTGATEDGFAAASLAEQGFRAEEPQQFRAEPMAQRPGGILHWLSEQFGPEIDKLKGLAIGAGLAAVRDMVQPVTPEPMRAQVNELFESFTERLGGEKIHGTILGGQEACDRGVPGAV